MEWKGISWGWKETDRPGCQKNRKNLEKSWDEVEIFQSIVSVNGNHMIINGIL